MTGGRESGIVLASASPGRAALLRAAEVEVEAVPAPIDEDAHKRELRAAGTDGADLAAALAERKAGAVAERRPGCAVIGCDQVLLFAGRVFDRPAGPAEARRQLEELRGGWHSLVSAVCVVEDGAPAWRFIDAARLLMRRFSGAFLDAYLDRIGPDASCGPGAYRVEGPGVQLFDRIEGDHATVIGLPLLPLLARLRASGRLPS